MTTSYLKFKDPVADEDMDVGDDDSEEEEEEEELEEDEEVGSSKKKKGNGGGEGASSGGRSTCLVESCEADLGRCKKYHQRHRVCELHAKATVVLVHGLRQRFCQQCSRFHELSEFDQSKRSCRRRLAGHNERRRKTALVGSTRQVRATTSPGDGDPNLGIL